MSPAWKYEAGVDPSSPINIEIGGGGDKCVQACDMEVGAGGYVQANIVRVGTSEQIYYHEIRMGGLETPSRHMGACLPDIVAHSVLALLRDRDWSANSLATRGAEARHSLA